MSDNVKIGTVIVAVLTLVTTTLAFGEQALQLINFRPSDEDNGTTQVDRPQPAHFTIEYPTNSDVAVEATISLNGEELGTIYTHQEPHQITETVSEGRYNYALDVTYLSTSNATSTQYSSASASASAAKCSDGTVAEGSSRVSISDGDRFTIYDNCEEATLQELN
jgi:hypothetical protein